MLTHLDEYGHAHMVDVGAKASSNRRAVAACDVQLSPEACEALRTGATSKGDVLATARIAGIMAAKRTAELIPLCHAVVLSHVAVDIQLVPNGVEIRATAQALGPTGVEMEAMTAVSVAALTLYDMLKGIDRGITVTSIRLLEKHGGKSGSWLRPSTHIGP